MTLLLGCVLLATEHSQWERHHFRRGEGYQDQEIPANYCN